MSSISGQVIESRFSCIQQLRGTYINFCRLAARQVQAAATKYLSGVFLLSQRGAHGCVRYLRGSLLIFPATVSVSGLREFCGRDVSGYDDDTSLQTLIAPSMVGVCVPAERVLLRVFVQRHHQSEIESPTQFDCRSLSTSTHLASQLGRMASERASEQMHKPAPRPALLFASAANQCSCWRQESSAVACALYAMHPPSKSVASLARFSNSYSSSNFCLGRRLSACLPALHLCCYRRRRRRRRRQRLRLLPVSERASKRRPGWQAEQPA